MNVLIHPGFHKTGTSWLQRNLFSGQTQFNSLFGHSEIDGLLVRPHDFDFSQEAVNRAVGKKMSAGPEGGIPVISSEILSGNIITGSRDSRILADRLHACFPEGKILLTIRNQRSALISVYVQYLKRGGRMRFQKFLDYSCDPGYHWFSASSLDFAPLADHYARRFGSENILVLPQELLASDPAAYLDELVQFASGGAIRHFDQEIDVNAVGKSPPNSGLFLMRWGNLFGARALNPEAIDSIAWIGAWTHKLAYRWKFREAVARKKLRDVAQDYVHDRYRRGNADLQKYCPVSLEALGYPV